MWPSGLWLVLGTSLFGGKGSNPFTVIISTFDCVLTIFYRSWPSIDVGLLAQLVRAPCLYRGGHEFDPLTGQCKGEIVVECNI